MGFLEASGCALIAFSAPLCLFIFFVASDPLRVIIFVGRLVFKCKNWLGILDQMDKKISSAFFWLLSLLVSSAIWAAIVPLRDELVFAALISVLSQEIFRFLYYLQLKYLTYFLIFQLLIVVYYEGKPNKAWKGWAPKECTLKASIRWKMLNPRWLLVIQQ